MKTVSIVRDRGQLTIPDSIRKIVSWVAPMSVVSISVLKPDKIIITPHKKGYNWDEIWQGIRRARAIKGKGKTVSAVELLEKDRVSH